MVATTAPRDASLGVLNEFLLHLERLAADVAAMKTDVRRMRRSLGAAVVPPPTPARGQLGQRRAALRLSQAQAGRAAGLSRSQVQALETGTCDGKWGTLAVYVAALDRLETAR